MFTLGTSLISVALGLVLGCFYDRQQEAIGATTILLVLFIGALFLKMVKLELPALIMALVFWTHSVALAEIFQFTFYESIDWGQAWRNQGSVPALSASLYALAIWRVRRMDR